MYGSVRRIAEISYTWIPSSAETKEFVQHLPTERTPKEALIRFCVVCVLNTNTNNNNHNNK